MSFVFYFTFLIYSEYHLAWQNNAESQSYICSTVYFSQIPAFVLSIGIILNLNKWIQYLFKILVFVKVNHKLDSYGVTGG